MPVHVVRFVAAGFLFLASVSAGRAQTVTFPYDHIHLNVPDPRPRRRLVREELRRQARSPKRPIASMFGSTRLMFLQNADAQPSAGSAIDHVGFSVADLDAKMKEFEAAGIKITTPARDVPGLFKLGFVEDPWGTRIEVVQDPELLGLHHIHLRAPNPDEVFAWLLASSAARRAAEGPPRRASLRRRRLQQHVDSGAEGRGGAEHRPRDRSHRLALGGPLTDTIAELGKDVEVTSEPRPLPLPNGPTINFSYVAGPAGARIELVERPGLKPGQ